MTYKIFLNHRYFNGLNLSIEADLPIIPRIGEYIDPYVFLTAEEAKIVGEYIELGSYMDFTYVRGVRHSIEDSQMIFLELDNTTFKERNHNMSVI